MNKCEFRDGETMIDETCARALAKITAKYIAGISMFKFINMED